MDELVVRAGVVAVVAVAVLLIARRTPKVRREWPTGVLDGPSIVFFSSRTCDSCKETRTILDEALAGRYREIGWEDDPDGWVEFGVDSVPTVVLVDRKRVVVDEVVGLPDESKLRRWGRRLSRF